MKTKDENIHLKKKRFINLKYLSSFFLFLFVFLSGDSNTPQKYFLSSQNQNGAPKGKKQNTM